MCIRVLDRCHCNSHGKGSLLHGITEEIEDSERACIGVCVCERERERDQRGLHLNQCQCPVYARGGFASSQKQGLRLQGELLETCGE